MFTSSRSRARNQQRQASSPPPPGSDSNYGVMSLNGSVFSDIVPASIAPGHTTAGSSSTASPAPSDIVPETPHQSDTPDPFGSTPNSPKLADSTGLQASPEIVPPSPDDTLHPLRAESPTPSRALSLAHIDSLYAADASVPSSPASFTSVSEVPSLSSLSRTSSPVSGIGYRHRQIGREYEVPDDLVLPTLSLPSSSLHMSLPRWEGGVMGLKVGIVGEREVVRDFMRQVEQRHELVDVGKGRMGALRDGKVEVTFVTSSTPQQIQRQVTDAYSALDGMLNPAPPPGKEDEMRKMICDYSERNDWIHLVLALDTEPASIDSLAELVPIFLGSDAQPRTSPGLSRHESTHGHNESRAPTPSPPRLGDDPTPMPSLSRAQSYFGSARAAPLDLLNARLDHPREIINASIAHFTAWRGVPTAVSTPLESSITSTSPASSAYGARAPMPTVARASGGGEWEATLSRRMADAHARQARSRASRRREDLERQRQAKDKCKRLLFPRPTRRITAVGLKDSWADILGEASLIARRAWKWGLVAAVVVAAVGLGYWVQAKA